MQFRSLKESVKSCVRTGYLGAREETWVNEEVVEFSRNWERVSDAWHRDEAVWDFGGLPWDIASEVSVVKAQAPIVNVVHNDTRGEIDQVLKFKEFKRQNRLEDMNFRQIALEMWIRQG